MLMSPQPIPPPQRQGACKILTSFNSNIIFSPFCLDTFAKVLYLKQFYIRK
jgi:hypothetical protein